VSCGLQNFPHQHSPVQYSVLLFTEVTLTKVQRMLLLELSEINPSAGCVYNIFYSVISALNASALKSAE
jgi:hypothetical protein